MMEALLVIVIAVLLDARFGEVRRWHPLIAFGNLAKALEKRLNGGRMRLLKGLLALSLALTVPLLLLWLLHGLFAFSIVLLFLLDGVVLYFAIGRRSLREHALAVRDPLLTGDLAAARLVTGRIVSRDTEQANEQELVTAVVETSLENTNDALVASLVWYALGGSFGVVLHRCSNTLDAMWGYRTERFNHFGRGAARLDDALAFIPAQLLSALYVICAQAGQRVAAARMWFIQGWRWKSVNAGSVMASGAAALGIRLGGSACYSGQHSERPVLGEGREPSLADIDACFALQNRVLCVFLFTLFILGVA
ncbi:adenosylcobinamide-phosphate synthase [Litorivivens lipolytica]|uniref:Cobalamin biosynthesis protein CobD n=1 Tax=Litorivivens lipolytica TaxID=1524264 RepID=A0A7W4W3P0_9GAMM|nr:CobD/CbiB family cobalamin biosynthesis protein [Litorivivens lipolytica]MBB3046856.1 adenosylcobinamide-phosphate synthase [Litorivivens lipolytica]